jgi:L-ascorbate metabolism protein UlaG (beta-lactamase superfamily)
MRFRKETEMEWTNELALPGGDVAPSDRAKGSIFFVGNATVILRYAGFTILTDPNFLHRGDHIHLGHGMTAFRRTDPALELAALPPIDFVLLSHMHEDHFDRGVERELDHSLPIVTTPHGAADLTSKGFTAAKALNTWESLTITKGGARVRVRSMPGAHAAGAVAKMLPPVMGSLIEFENSRGDVVFRIYITGDTVLRDELKEIPRRFPDIDVAMLHLGGTMFFGLLMVTMDPKQGVEVIRLTKPKTAIPIHYDDYSAFEFALGDTTVPPAADPPEWWHRTKITSFEEFAAMAKEASPSSEVHILRRGETYTFSVPESLR